MHVTDDGDDPTSDVGTIRTPIHPDGLPQWLLIGEVALGECLGYRHHGRPASAIVRGEGPAPEHGHPHCLEIVGGDDPDLFGRVIRRPA